ncbi:YbjQ family protein [Actinomadura rubrisoli]|uniref:Heavy metal-binding domain-containing protein n=1 Tax=Actinomadura rubrisoli TaxID=2530368 RepID=A0A4R5ATZ7_9ACTN|nr:heavy metal-binding domain-containing protein [Actinomadura rubrisoli]TDD76788.1 heavy metal-binding domain-containing protein [Actinomadura rubrisoli]
MLIVTTDGVAGYEIRRVLGEVLGTSAQADQGRAAVQHGQAGSSATFRVTGEQPGAGLAAARREAIDRLGEEARRKGANTVVGMRFDTAALSGGGYEVCAYGTAVWADPASQGRDQMQQMQQPGHPPQGHVPSYGDPQPGGPPMAARNLTMGLHDRPR